MRKEWNTPQILVQQFVPNEYVAACGDTQYGNYLFTCDAGGGVKGDVYTSDGRNLTAGSTRYFHACGTQHEAPKTDEFIDGYYIQNGGDDQTRYWSGGLFGGWKDYEKVPVIIWTDGGTDVHATTNLNRDSWETAKS